MKELRLRIRRRRSWRCAGGVCCVSLVRWEICSDNQIGRHDLLSQTKEQINPAPVWAAGIYMYWFCKYLYIISSHHISWIRNELKCCTDPPPVSGVSITPELLRQTHHIFRQINGCIPNFTHVYWYFIIFASCNLVFIQNIVSWKL